MNIQETDLGYTIDTPKFTALFGGKNANFARLQSAYPDLQLLRLKQIHSDAVVESTRMSPDFETLADSHYTFDRSLGLCVSTADCLPVLIYDASLKLVAGIHAGWRGVANRIVPKTLQKILSLGASLSTLQILIGPHIQKSSFEVGYDVRDQILSTLGPLSTEDKLLFTEKISDTKALVDLSQVMKMQLQLDGVQADQVFSLHIDTVNDLRFHSYRRDKESSGRQLSFIALK